MPKKYSGMEVGGVEFQFSATELKLLNKYVAELTKVKTLRQGIVLTYKRQQELAKKDLEAGKQDTKAAIQRKEVLTDIVKIMNDTRKFRQALQKTIPKIEEKQNKEGKKQLSTLDLLKKKYAWQLIYFTALAGTLAMAVGNSKLLGHFFDIIGSALGFVLDMLLLPFIDGVVWLVTKLFELGGWISSLPGWVRIAIVALGLLFGPALALIFYGVLKNIVARIIAIGVEAAASSTALDILFGKKPPVVAPAPVPGAPPTVGAGGTGIGVGAVLGAGGMLFSDMIARWIETGKLRFSGPQDIYNRAKPFNDFMDSLFGNKIPGLLQNATGLNPSNAPINSNVTVFIDGLLAQRIQGVNLNVVQ